MSSLKHRPGSARYHVEDLELRRLLAAAAASIVDLEWSGATIEARAGEWIVGVERQKERLVEADQGPVWLPAITRATEPRADIRAAFDVLRNAGITFGRYLGSADVFTIRTPTDLAANTVARLLENVPGFAYVEPNGVGKLSAVTPNDTFFTEQWALNNTGQSHTTFNPSGTASGTSDADIDAAEAWAITKGRRASSPPSSIRASTTVTTTT